MRVYVGRELKLQGALDPRRDSRGQKMKRRLSRWMNARDSGMRFTYLSLFGSFLEINLYRLFCR